MPETVLVCHPGNRTLHLDVMESTVFDALLERAMTYLPFVVYDGNTRGFVLCLQRGYVDAAGLALEHQHVRFSNLCSAILKERNVDAAWEALEPSERQVIHLACPETRDAGCRTLKPRLSTKTDLYRLVALLQFVAYEGHAILSPILQTWRLVQFVAAAVKGGSRASQWSLDAWQHLTLEERDAWKARFGSNEYKPKDIKRELTTFCAQQERNHPYLDALATCQKRRDLLAFHALVLKTAGPIPEKTVLPEVTWRTTRALRVLVDRDKSPFPLAMVAMVVHDGTVVSALRDYFAFWRGHKSATVFKRWDHAFWQGKPTALYYVTRVVRRYARLRSSLARFVSFSQPKRGECCPCETTALYCKDCLELKSIPNFSHPPPGRAIAFDVNADRVVCQLCKSTRIIGVPLFNSLNPSTTLSLSHPDRNPLHICDGSPLCFVKTSYTGTCRSCDE